MEYTKENLLDTCIKITSVSQSNKILQFYQSFGFFLKTKKSWKCPKERVGDLIGPSPMYPKENGVVHIYYSSAGVEIIELPSKPRREFPREMMVSHNNKDWYKRTVVAKVKTNTPYIAIALPYSIKDTCDIDYTGWKFAKEIESKSIEELIVMPTNKTNQP